MANRPVIIVVAFTVVATLYSLSELHSLSVQQAAQESVQFASQSVQQDSKAQGSSSSSSTTDSNNAGTTSIIAATKAATAAAAKTAATLQTTKGSDRKCYTYPNTEFWGDVVIWGSNTKAKSAEECCDMCKKYTPATADDPDCNVWVWCGEEKGCKGQYQQCWGKHLAHPEATKPARQGPEVPWTSGSLDVDVSSDPGKIKSKGGDRKFHIVSSAQGTAVHWQIRIHYYWYKKQKSICEKSGSCDMGGFTRLLHSGKADDLMNEIPTMVVDPLPSDMVEHSWYVVLNRPYAFVQWVKKAQIPEKYVLMAEPDHIFLRPIPNFMNGDTPASFPFFYIEPAKAEYQQITMKYTGKVSKKQLEEIAPIGNSPTFMTMEDMKRVMPIWMNTSIAIFKDTESNQAWGWVQEMYGFTIALWIGGCKHVDLYLHMMSQPPWDTNMEMTKNKPFYILHYTYGMDYKLTGEFTPGKYGEWRFDKRSFSGRPIPRHLGDPPKNMKNDLVRALITSFNEATDAIPCWDKYAETGKIPETCDEKPKHFLAEEAAAKSRKML